MERTLIYILAGINIAIGFILVYGSANPFSGRGGPALGRQREDNDKVLKASKNKDGSKGRKG